MHTFRQLLRQPMKTVSGVILIALAVAILCVCVGQAAVAANMQANLDTVCTSAALITEKYQLSTSFDYRTQSVEYFFEHDQPDEVIDWLYDIAEQYPEVVEQINRPGLASAWIPELTADNYTSHLYDMTTNSAYSQFLSNGTNDTNYSHVMLEITLNKIGEFFRGEVELEGTIESYLALQEGYNDVTGYNAKMTLKLPNTEALDGLDLEIGQRYLVYGMDYTDLDWDIRYDVAANGHGCGVNYDPPEIDYFHLENWVPFPDGYVEDMGWVEDFEAGEIEEYNVGYYEHPQIVPGGNAVLRGVHLTNLDMEKFRTVTFTIRDLSSLSPDVDPVYSVPTIAKLEGSVDAFLASAEGALWKEFQQYIQINNQCFPVVGVDDLMATGDFILQNTVISSGRNFTDEELAAGEKVCVISEEVAALSGLAVGDTITLNYYSIDPDYPYQKHISHGYGTANPSAYIYCGTTEFAGAGETYTIVGLYQKDLPWEGSNSPYDFRVNTIFAPKASVSGEMDFGESGIFLSAVIRNGMADTFEALVNRDGHSGLFSITDQNYDSIKENLHNYEEISRDAVIIGVVMYAVLLLLFLLFYPAMQRMTLSVMAKLGAHRRDMLAYMMTVCLGILLPGTVAGLALGAGMWDHVIAALTESSWTTLTLELDMMTMLAIAGGQLLLASILVFMVSLGMSLSKNLMNRQKFRISIPGLKRLPIATAGALAFALIIALSLCALSAANEAEYASYEVSVQEAEVTVGLVHQAFSDPYMLMGSLFVKELVYEDRFSFSLLDYLEDMKYMNNLTCTSINGEVYDQTIWGMNSNAEPEILSEKWNAQIHWLDEYDASCMDSYGDMYLLVPEQMEFEDIKSMQEGTQVELQFSGYACMATIAGTYTNDIDSETIYCSIEPLFFCGNRINQRLGLQHFSATVRDNSTLAALREEANRYFIDPEAGEDQAYSEFMTSFVFYIYDDALDRLRVTLENSIQFNELCAMLIFTLSAGAGFILGFLMIRSRKREIILMRTLGRANWSIYVSYALEQMACIAAGAALGGAVFNWQPLDRLLVFVGIYFVGLSAALIVFLNSKLLTTIKEDE